MESQNNLKQSITKGKNVNSDEIFNTLEVKEIEILEPLYNIIKKLKIKKGKIFYSQSIRKGNEQDYYLENYGIKAYLLHLKLDLLGETNGSLEKTQGNFEKEFNLLSKSLEEGGLEERECLKKILSELRDKRGIYKQQKLLIEKYFNEIDILLD